MLIPPGGDKSQFVSLRGLNARPPPDPGLWPGLRTKSSCQRRASYAAALWLGLIVQTEARGSKLLVGAFATAGFALRGRAAVSLGTHKPDLEPLLGASVPAASFSRLLKCDYVHDVMHTWGIYTETH